MPRTTADLRRLWRAYECNAAEMVSIPFGPDRIRVAKPAASAFAALADIMIRHRYAVRPADTDSYNCRTITGGRLKSLHAYGIAVDVNWTTNPTSTIPAPAARASPPNPPRPPAPSTSKPA